jgi:hypothetical protein
MPTYTRLHDILEEHQEDDHGGHGSGSGCIYRRLLSAESGLVSHVRSGDTFAWLTPHCDTHVGIHDKFGACHIEHELGSVVPYLERNRLRPRVRAIRDSPNCVPCQGAETSPSCCSYQYKYVFDALTGNAEVAFPSRTATIAAAPPATTAATSLANAAAVVASVMSTLTTTVTGSLPPSAAATSTITPILLLCLIDSTKSTSMVYLVIIVVS